MSTRSHGRKGKLLMDQTPGGGGSASPLAVLNKWTLAGNTDQVDVSSFDDSTKVYVAGLPDAQGTIAGWYDFDSDQTYTASQDGVARKFYLYPNKTDHAGNYFFGTAFFDFSASGGTGEANAISGNWKAATSVFRVQS